MSHSQNPIQNFTLTFIVIVLLFPVNWLLPSLNLPSPITSFVFPNPSLSEWGNPHSERLPRFVTLDKSSQPPLSISLTSFLEQPLPDDPPLLHSPAFAPFKYKAHAVPRHAHNKTNCPASRIPSFCFSARSASRYQTIKLMAGQLMTKIMVRRPVLAHPTLALISASPHPRVLQRSKYASNARVIESDSSSHPATFRYGPSSKTTLRVRRSNHQRPQLVIFDKDGTLICFHSLWVPWVRSFAEKVEEAGIVGIASKVYHALGFCPILKKVKRGLLAEGTMRQIRDRVVNLLVQHGLDMDEAMSVVAKAIHGSSAIPFAERTVRQLHDLEALFAKLKERGIKIAICTADSRAGTMRVLRTLRVEELVDLVVCGDDKGSVPKPHPNNALFICRQLGVQPKDAMVIGDTPADLGMGRSAKLGSIVGVLSGIGEQKELASEADHLVEHVGELLPLIG